MNFRMAIHVRQFLHPDDHYVHVRLKPDASRRSAQNNRDRGAGFRVLARGQEPATTPLAQAMTQAPVTIGPERSFGHAMAVMQQHHCRHLPVVEDGRPIGIVSARNALDPALEDFVCEERRRRSFEAG